MKKELTSFFVTDFWRKIGALAIALIVWTGIRADLQRNRTIENLPVTVELDQDRWVMLAAPPHVSIALRGSERRLNALNIADIAIAVKIPKDAQLHAGGHPHYLATLGIADVSLPRGTRGVSCHAISPAQIEVEVDRLETLKAVSVHPQLPGDAAHLASQLVVTPAAIEVAGPASQLKTLTSILTLPVDPRQLDDGRKIEAMLEEKPFLRYSPAHVQLSLKNSLAIPAAP